MARMLLGVVFLMILAPFPAVSAVPQTRLVIATEPPNPVTGTFSHDVATKLAEWLPRAAPGVELTPVPTMEFAERLIAEKRAHIGFTNSVLAWEAWHGVEPFGGSPIRVIRTLTPAFSSIFTFATLEGTGISTVADLRGKRVGFLLPAFPQRQSRRILQAAGLDPDRDIRKEEIAFPAILTALAARRIDAFGVPSPPIVALQVWIDLAMTTGAQWRLVPTDTVLPALRRQFGNAYQRVVYQREFLPGLPADVPTAGFAGLVIVHEEMSPEVAYQITRLIYENRRELAQAHRLAQFITFLGAAERSPIPYHPGAIRYFKERGVEGF